MRNDGKAGKSIQWIDLSDERAEPCEAGPPNVEHSP